MSIKYLTRIRMPHAQALKINFEDIDELETAVEKSNQSIKMKFGEPIEELSTSYQELIMVDKNVDIIKAFFDFDCQWEYTDQITDEDFDTFEYNTITALVNLISSKLPDGCQVVAIDTSSAYDFTDKDGNDASRISIHLVTNYLCTMLEANTFAINISKLWPSHITFNDISPDNSLENGIDLSVYGNNKKLRMRWAFPSKIGEIYTSERQKQPYVYPGVNNEFADSLVTFIPSDWAKTTNPPKFSNKREIPQQLRPAKKARVEKDDMDVKYEENTTNDNKKFNEQHKFIITKFRDILHSKKSKFDKDSYELLLFKLIPALLDNYITWFDFVKGIHYAYDGDDLGEAIVHEFSKLSKKYNQDEIKATYYSLSSDEDKCVITTLGTFFMHLKIAYQKQLKKSVDIYAHFSTNKDADDTEIIEKDKFNWFLYRLKGEAYYQKYSNSEISITAFRKHLERRKPIAEQILKDNDVSAASLTYIDQLAILSPTITYISLSDEYCVDIPIKRVQCRKEENLPEFEYRCIQTNTFDKKGIASKFGSYTFIVPGQPKPFSFSDRFFNGLESQLLNTKEEVSWIPESADFKCPAHIKNMYQPLPFSGIDEELPSYTGDINSLVRYLYKLFGSGPAVAYIINWIAFFRQHPEIKCCILVLCGPEGCGKSTIAKLIQLLCGSNVSVHVEDIKHLFGDFNGILHGKYFIHVEEGDSFKVAQYYSQIKTLITDGTMQYHNKHKERKCDKTFHKILVSTNHSSIFPAGRRPSQFECDPTLIGDDKLFEAMNKRVDDSRPYTTFMQNCAKFFDTRDLSKFDPRKAYKSQLAMEVLYNSFESKCCRFMLSLKPSNINRTVYEYQQTEIGSKWKEMFPDGLKNDQIILTSIKTFIIRCFGKKYEPTKNRISNLHYHVFDMNLLKPKIEEFENNDYEADCVDHQDESEDKTNYLELVEKETIDDIVKQQGLLAEKKAKKDAVVQPSPIITNPKICVYDGV